MTINVIISDGIFILFDLPVTYVLLRLRLHCNWDYFCQAVIMRSNWSHGVVSYLQMTHQFHYVILNVDVIYLNAYGTNMELPTRVRTASFRGGIKGAVAPTSKS